MDTDDMLTDDFLADLIRKVPLESPSEEFIDKVMTGLEPLPGVSSEKRPYFLWFNSIIPYIVLGLALILIFYSSDIPFLNVMHGKEFLSGIFVKIFQPFWFTMKSLLSSKFVTYSLLIGVSAGFLFIIDKLFSRRFAA